MILQPTSTFVFPVAPLQSGAALVINDFSEVIVGYCCFMFPGIFFFKRWWPLEQCRTHAEGTGLDLDCLKV